MVMIPLAVGAIVGLVTALLSIGRPKVKGGWVVLRPTLLLYGVGILAVPMAAFFLAIGFLGLIVPPVRELGPHFRLIAAGEILLGLMFPYCTATTFCVRVRFNDSGVEKSWLSRSAFIPWAEIRKINRSILKGPQLLTASGRGVPISEYLVGFPDLLAMAHSRGVVISDEFRS